MNFVSKDKLLSIFNIPQISGSGGVLSLRNDGISSLYNPYQNFGYNNWTDTSNKRIQHFNSISGYYEDLNMNIIDGPASNNALLQSLLSYYPYWSNVKWMYQCISVSPIGDGIVPNSFEVLSGTDYYKDYTLKQLNRSGMPGFSNDDYGVGAILKNDDSTTVFGYVWYDRGLILTYGSLQQTISNWNNVSATSSIMKYSTYLDKKEDKYCCGINRKHCWSTSNPSYWTSIDESNTTITSTLTAYWNQYSLTGLTIESNAKDWLIVEEQDYPLYITGIGLYNDNNELLAVAKLRNPQSISKNTYQSFVVQLNY